MNVKPKSSYPGPIKFSIRMVFSFIGFIGSFCGIMLLSYSVEDGSLPWPYLLINIPLFILFCGFFGLFVGIGGKGYSRE